MRGRDSICITWAYYKDGQQGLSLTRAYSAVLRPHVAPGPYGVWLCGQTHNRQYRVPRTVHIYLVYCMHQHKTTERFRAPGQKPVHQAEGK